MALYELLQQEARDHIEVTVGTAVVVGGAIGAMATRAVSRTLHVDGSYSFAAEDPAQYAAVMDGLAEAGEHPRLAVNDDLMRRAVYPGGFILNRTHPELWAEMGEPSSGPIFQTRRPEAAAVTLAGTLRDRHGFDVRTMPHPRTANKLWFVVNDHTEKPDGTDPRHLPWTIGFRRAFPLLPGRPKLFPRNVADAEIYFPGE